MNVAINSVPQLYLYLLRGVSNKKLFVHESTRKLLREQVRMNFRPKAPYSTLEQQVMLQRAVRVLQYLYNV